MVVEKVVNSDEEIIKSELFLLQMDFYALLAFLVNATSTLEKDNFLLA
ncbi:MAG: hypothetical protein V7L05_22675 [Nostoc sp.]